MAEIVDKEYDGEDESDDSNKRDSVKSQNSKRGGRGGVGHIKTTYYSKRQKNKQGNPFCPLINSILRQVNLHSIRLK